jgi:hypothetical protein
MTAIRRTSKRGKSALLLGLLLVGCSSVVATSQERSEQKSFVKLSGNGQTSNRDDHERKLEKYGDMLVTHGEKGGKTRKESHEASEKVLITYGQKDSKVKQNGHEQQKKSDFVLVTHGAKSAKGEPETKPPKGAGSKGGKEKNASTKSKGEGKGTKSKGKGMPRNEVTIT